MRSGGLSSPIIRVTVVVTLTTYGTILLGLPGRRTFGIRGLDLSGIDGPVLLGTGERLAVDGGPGAQLTLPERMPVRATYAIRLGRGVQPPAAD
jgi:hypothetical protein